MNNPKLIRSVFLLAVLSSFHVVVSAQVKVSGTVYDRSLRFGMQGVSVMGTAGAGSITDSSGHYTIQLPLADSISFSYLGKSTRKFPVKELPPYQAFDISLEVSVDSLPPVFVRPNDYRMDSLENRKEYRKVFDFEKNYLVDKGPGGGFGVGVSLDALFSAKKMRQIETLKRRLEQEERDKYVNHRFTRGLVRRITGLQSPALDTFMIKYKPSYEILLSFENEYEYYKFIKDWGKIFYDIWKEEHPG